MTSTLPYNEKLLLEQIAAGDRDAFKAVHDKYWNDLYTVALSFLKSPDWSMDIIQDVFFKIWVKKETLTEIDDFSSYLFIITRNELITALKSRSRMLERHQNYVAQLPTGILAPDTSFNLKEMETVVQRAIEQLPAQEKKMFILTRNQGLTHDEVAAQLGTSKKSVANTLTRALNRIRTYLKEYESDGALLILISIALFGDK